MLRGHRSRVVLAALLSVGAVVGQILITLLVGDAADQIDDGDRGELVRSGAGAEDGVVQMRRAPVPERRRPSHPSGAHSNARNAHSNLAAVGGDEVWPLPDRRWVLHSIWRPGNVELTEGWLDVQVASSVRFDSRLLAPEAPRGDEAPGNWLVARDRLDLRLAYRASQRLRGLTGAWLARPMLANPPAVLHAHTATAPPASFLSPGRSGRRWWRATATTQPTSGSPPARAGGAPTRGSSTSPERCSPRAPRWRRASRRSGSAG